MAITDDQFNAWLIRDNVARCVLVEVEAYSGGSVVTRYMSTHGFVSTGTDTPLNTPFDDILLAVPRYVSLIGEQLRGFSSPSTGEIVVDNSSGVRDAWLLDAWDGRPFRLYLGDPGWPKSDFRLMVAGTVADIQARDYRTLTLRTRDRQHLLTLPVCTTLVGGTDATKEARRPVCYGECFNVEPVLIDSTARRYAVHDGQIDAVVAVYEDGAAKAFTADLPTGTFTLTTAAAGRITADVRGSKTAGTYVNKTGDILQRILTERTAITVSDIDTTSVTQLNTDVPGVVGLYVTGDETTMQALDMLVTGCGAFYSFDRSGKFYVQQFKAPTGSPVLTILGDDVEDVGVAVVNRWLPSKSVRLGYKRQWTQQSDGLAASVSDARRAELAQPYLITKATNSVPQHLLSEDPPVEASLFISSVDASSEATRRATLYGTIRRLIQVTCFLGPSRVKLGDVVALDLTRYGLTGGVLARVMGIDEAPTEKRVTLTVFL